MRSFLYSLLVVSCLSLTLRAGPGVTTSGLGVAAESNGGRTLPNMPKQCRPGKTSTEAMGWRWRPGARVHVYYLKSDFSAEEAVALSRAVESWNRALGEIDSRITFVKGGEREDVAETDLSLTVLRGVPKGKDRLGQIRFYTMSNGVMRATVVMSPEVTGQDALVSLMTHELGHSLGLADCYECKRGTTAMSAFKDLSRGNEVYEPSECDKYVVAAGYAGVVEAQARIARPEGK